MKTKEELLFVTPTIEHNGTTWHSNNGTKRVMDEFAKEVAIDFSQWAASSGWELVFGAFAWERLGDSKQLSTGELYNLYQQEK